MWAGACRVATRTERIVAVAFAPFPCARDRCHCWRAGLCPVGATMSGRSFWGARSTGAPSLVRMGVRGAAHLVAREHLWCRLFRADAGWIGSTGICVATEPERAIRRELDPTGGDRHRQRGDVGIRHPHGSDDARIFAPRFCCDGTRAVALESGPVVVAGPRRVGTAGACGAARGLRGDRCSAGATADRPVAADEKRGE